MIDERGYSCDPECLPAGTLVILDGFDELAASLDKVYDFRDFYCMTMDWAERTGRFHFIITSRTTCIERELREGRIENRGWKVASFAPMTIDQQKIVIDRMIELDKNSCGEKKNKITEADFRKDSGKGGRAVKDLKDYRSYYFDVLWKEDKIRELLEIPILFRMIVACRFENEESAGR